nr:MAG TPA: hypothetical protein [Caudoviricetes sp.]
MEVNVFDPINKRGARDTECYLVHSVLILPEVPYCNWMPSAFEMVT